MIRFLLLVFLFSCDANYKPKEPASDDWRRDPFFWSGDPFGYHRWGHHPWGSPRWGYRWGNRWGDNRWGDNRHFGLESSEELELNSLRRYYLIDPAQYSKEISKPGGSKSP